VETVLFTVASPAPATQNGRGGSADDEPTMPKTPRPALTQKGTALIGDMRTDALHAALRDEPIDDGRLIALLVLALAGRNVEVKSGLAGAAALRDTRRDIAATLTEGGAVTSDPAVLQAAARSMLACTLSCRENWSQSGPVARIAGDAIGADAHLPNMATAEFLSCLSKAAVEDVAISLDVPVQPTGKATRGAVIARVGGARWLYPAALFAAEGAAEEVMPEDEAPGDPLDEDADRPMDGTDAEAPPTDDGAPDADEPPAVPVRRRRLRKDLGDAQAAA